MRFQPNIVILLPDGDKIEPIEMKSSGYNTHASLDAFFQKYHARIKQQYLVYTKNLRKDGMITVLPCLNNLASLPDPYFFF